MNEWMKRKGERKEGKGMEGEEREGKWAKKFENKHSPNESFTWQIFITIYLINVSYYMAYTGLGTYDAMINKTFSLLIL